MRRFIRKIEKRFRRPKFCSGLTQKQALELNLPDPLHRSGAVWLLAPRRLAPVLAAAFLLCWPMLVMGGPLLFYDTPGYLRGGEAIMRMLFRLATGSGEDVGGGVSGAGIGALAEEAEAIRSIPWSLFAYIAALPFGLVGIAVLQNAAVLVFLLAMLRGTAPASPRHAFVAFLAIALLTPLPWYGSLIMPDLLAAAVILYGLVLVRGIDDLGLLDRTAVGLLGAFAILSHQGYLPVAGVVVLAALSVRFLRGRRLGFAVALTAIGPTVLAILVMLGGSAAFLDGPSIAPRRFPILLARSIADGPARWHLVEHCEIQNYAVCGMFETIPDNVGDVLWGPDGLNGIASTDEMRRIREEEPVILWRAFTEYPLQQIWSLCRNAVVQFVLVGGRGLSTGEILPTPEGGSFVNLDDERGRTFVQSLAILWALSASAAGFWIISLAVRGRLSPAEQDMTALLWIGLVANAVVFGGLSAPVDRYQTRVVWLVPAMAAIFWLRRCATTDSVDRTELGGGAMPSDGRWGDIER